MNLTDTADSITVLLNFLPFRFFRYLPPINLTFAVYIIIQNSMVIYHYFKDWKRLSSLLFILIAAVDIGSACFAIARGAITVWCDYNQDMAMPFLLYVTIIMCGNMCYITSTFFGMILTVVKTISIINPFYRIRGRALKLCLVLFSLFGLVLSVADTICMNLKWSLYMTKCKDQLFSWIVYGIIKLSIGTATLEEIINCLFNSSDKPVRIFRNFIDTWGILSFELYLPCLIVFVCMILQIVHIKRAFSQSADPRQDIANHATVTIFLISFLYLSSNSVHLCSLIVYFAHRRLDRSIESLEVRLVAWFTLTLVNSALFPTILILRKAELRATYRGYISSVLRLPVTVFYYIRHRGYTEI